MKENTQRLPELENVDAPRAVPSIRAYPCQGLDSMELKVIAEGISAAARLLAFISGLSESEAVAEVRTEENGFRIVFRPGASEEYVWSLARSIMLMDLPAHTDASHTRRVK